MNKFFSKSHEYFNDLYNTYINKQMLILLALGFSSGFPFLLVFGTLTLWLKQSGISLELIGYFSLVKIPYSLKWTWSPIIDNTKIPYLYKMGRRRSWAIVVQLSLFMSLLCMSFINPAEHVSMMALFALLSGFLSASQDIILDAYRVECFTNKPEKQASGVAVFVLGYRLGLIYSGAGALYLAALYDWNKSYIFMSMGMLVGLFAILAADEKVEFIYKKYEGNIKKFFKDSVVKPLKDFTQQANWFWILVLIFTYHLSNAYFAPVIYPFYDEIGFTNIEIANVMKLYGMVAAISGGFTGGYIITKIGLRKSMIYFAVLQCLSTMLFSAQAIVGHNMVMFITVITIENFCSGLATTALVAYVSSLCNKLYTATQYALLSSVMSISRDVFSSSSGKIVQLLGWENFFIFSACLSLPSIFIILTFIKKDK